MSTLEIDDVTKLFGTTRVLDKVTLHVEAGTTTAIVGASGCGKTTLLRIIAGFETADSGRISIAGKVVVDGAATVPPHRRNVGIVPQDGALFPHMTVGHNVAYGLARPDKGRVAELLSMVALDPEMANRRPHQLSGGQQQRVALARALALQPAVMLLDEPFSQLDTRLRADTRREVAKTLGKAGVTTLLVTHDQEEALSFADQVAVMRDGVFTQVGSPEDAYNRPTDRFTAEFMGECVVLAATVTDAVATCALGEIAVTGERPASATHVILRPEQLVARPASDGIGTVMSREFLGADTMLTISLRTGELLTVRQPAREAPEVGGIVAITVIGSAVALS